VAHRERVSMACSHKNKDDFDHNDETNQFFLQNSKEITEASQFEEANLKKSSWYIYAIFPASEN